MEYYQNKYFRIICIIIVVFVFSITYLISVPFDINYNKKRDYLQILGLIISICLIIYLVFKNYKIQNFTDFSNNNIIFFDKNQTYNYIKNDNDEYIKNMSDFDLNERSVFSAEDYKKRSAKTAVTFNNLEKTYITALAMRVDAYLMKQDSIKTSKLPPWTFALTDGTIYELGNPHTRGENNEIYFLSVYELSQYLRALNDIDGNILVDPNGYGISHDNYCSCRNCLNKVKITNENKSDNIVENCQLSWVLLFLRMYTMFPDKQQDMSIKTYYRMTHPLNYNKTKFPENWKLPTCETFADPKSIPTYSHPKPYVTS